MSRDRGEVCESTAADGAQPNLEILYSRRGVCQGALAISVLWHVRVLRPYDMSVFLMPYVCMSEACKSLHSHISFWGFVF